MAFVSAMDLMSINRQRLDLCDLLFLFSKAGSGRKRLCFRLSDHLMTVAKMRTGDRVDVLFDKSAGMGIIKRSERGWKLSGKSGYTASVHISFQPGLPSVPESVPLEHEVKKDGIYFIIPDSATWDENGASVEQKKNA